QVFVRGLDGKTLVFPVPLSATALELKDAIRSKTGVRPKAQVLTFAGQVLRGNKTLADYNIARDATITLSLRLRGGV
ncbi:Ubiquitin-related domain-containing protein, partial [Rhodotorula toruloides]